MSFEGVTALHLVRCFSFWVHIWATEVGILGAGVCSVHPVGCCMLAAGAPNSCTPTSAATSAPAPPSICINLSLHIFSSKPLLFSFGCFQGGQLWEGCVHLCTSCSLVYLAAPVHSGHPTIAHLAPPQVDASHITNVHSLTKKFQVYA